MFIATNEVKCAHNANRYILFIKSIMEKNKTRDFTNIKFELHHILPKSMGGSNGKENIIKLTYREHYIAHLILAQTYKNRKMYCAVGLFGGKNKSFNSRMYDILKRNSIDALSGENHPLFGKPRSTNTKEKIRNKKIGKKHTQETKEKIAESLRGENNPSFGKPCSTNTKEKIRNSLRGHIVTIDTKNKISATLKGRGTGSANSNAKKISIDGKIYNTRKEAAELLKIRPSTITDRCKSDDPKWNEWKYI